MVEVGSCCGWHFGTFLLAGIILYLDFFDVSCSLQKHQVNISLYECNIFIYFFHSYTGHKMSLFTEFSIKCVRCIHRNEHECNMRDLVLLFGLSFGLSLIINNPISSENTLIMKYDLRLKSRYGNNYTSVQTHNPIGL